MNRLITLFFILILAQASILAQQRTRSKKSKTNVEKFVLAPYPEAIDSDSIKVVTFMEIPYHALQFVKKENSFLAHYQASLSIRRKKGKEIGNMIWTDSIEVNLYTDTRSAMKNKKQIEVIEEEIKHLDSIIEPQDCGNLITCRNVLEANLEQLMREREQYNG